MSLWLTFQELQELTGYKTYRRQKMALGEMGIPFHSRPADGYPLVERSQFERVHTVLKGEKNRRKPNLELVR